MHQRPRLAALALVVLALAACGGGDDDDAGSYGGAEGLPGPLASGVEFEEPPAGGVPAPEFSAELLDGTTVPVGELWDDRPAVLLFTASWCETCKDVHRKVAEAVAEHGGSIALLAVVPGDDAEGAREYADQLELEHPVAVADDRIWLDYAAREPPLVVLVAPGGSVLRGWPGGVEEDVLAGQLEALFASPANQER